MMLPVPESWFAPRLSLGLGNPNSAGALLAMALASVWPLCLGGWRRRAIGLLATMGFGLAIAMTASRGAFAALAVGCAVILITRISRTDRWFLIFALAVVAIIFAGSPARERIHAPQADPSFTSRWTVLSQVPAMMAAAPGGWGQGRSAEAYQNWFQTPGDSTLYRHILSSHAIWLVEHSWGWGAGYVLVWALVLTWCAVQAPPRFAGGLACWVVFGVSACFSHVGEMIWLWILPIFWLTVLTGWRLWAWRFPPWRVTVSAVFGALVLFGGVILLGRPWGAGPRLRSGVVEVGTRVPAGKHPQGIGVILPQGMWIRAGQEIRRRLPAETTVKYAWDNDAGLQVDTLFLMGLVTYFPLAKESDVKRVVWVAPARVVPRNLPAGLRAAWITVVAAQPGSVGVLPWQKYFDDGGRGEIKIAMGQGNVVADPWGALLAVEKLSF